MKNDKNGFFCNQNEMIVDSFFPQNLHLIIGFSHRKD